MYNSIDTAALNAARKAGFLTTATEIVENDITLSGLSCPLEPDCTEPAETLSKAIEALDRFTENTTVWLEITPAAYVPRYVIDAVRKLSGYGTKLIVTCGQASTHLPGPALDKDLCDAVAEANTGAPIWHPLAKKLVNGDPRYLQGSC